jgi:hypothetical protein
MTKAAPRPIVVMTLMGALGTWLAAWWRLHPITAAVWVERLAQR